jgi:hypothetical protein
MNPIPGNAWVLRDDGGIRRAAMLVIDEFGESAAEYAATRAMVLQRQGDEMGASRWRRIAPVIEEMQRKAPVLTRGAHQRPFTREAGGNLRSPRWPDKRT